MAGLMWMGPRGRELWVPCPATGMEAGLTGWNAKSQYLNGGASVRSSTAAHMEYDMSWNLASRKSLRPITDMFSGVRGPGLIYFIDPMAADQNVLPASWAFPAQACYDAIPLLGSVRPANVPTAPNGQEYPAESARYVVGPGAVSRTVYVPIPTGMTAWVGVHGETTGPMVAVTPYATGNVAGAVVPLTLLPVDSAERVNASFDGGAYRGIELSVIPAVDGSVVPFPSEFLYPDVADYPASGIGQLIILSGLIVQILPTGVVPATGEFISGQGNSGCKFEEAPAVTAYSAALDKVGMSAKLVEVGDHL